jgi:SAM-dependent methyltransferase
VAAVLLARVWSGHALKRAALAFLVCPACRVDLALTADALQGNEVLEGALTCAACGRTYPITRGVPRFVAAGQYAESFGFQWTRFRTVQLDSVNGTDQSARELDATTGWTEADLRGRLVLDAGVGAGRFAEVVARRRAEVVGVDLTAAVDAAYANLGALPAVHLVQADIFALPFRDGTFDFAYSVGVLHHTPNPRGAFARVAATVRKGGQMAIYVYAGYGNWYRGSDLLRRVTTRLPLRLVFWLSAAAVPLHYVYRLPVIGWLLRLGAPISPHPDARWRWLDTFDWYTPQYQWKHFYPEVLRWFRTEGFTDVEVFDAPIRLRGVKAG